MIKKLKKNDLGKDYFVGDIHGCYGQLMEALAKIKFNVDIDRLICVGDLVDRGPESELCLKMTLEPWFFSVRGNHEAMLIESTQRLNGIRQYERAGGSWFLNLPQDKRLELCSVAEKLPYFIAVDTNVGKIGVLHADALVDSWANYDNLTEDSIDYHRIIQQVIWGRNRIWVNDQSHVEDIDYIVVGHTALVQVMPLGNVVYIDTGLVYYVNGEDEDCHLTIMTPEQVRQCVLDGPPEFMRKDE